MIFLFANNVLRDCEIALTLLREEHHTDIWRVHWVGAIALVRAVGHVLRYRDRKEYPDYATKIDAAFESWKHGDQHRIFREFISQERNNVLKEYAFAPHDLSGARLTTEAKPGQTPLMWLPDEHGNKVPHYQFDVGPYRLLMRGYQVGENSTDIYERAVEWWQIELEKIGSG